MKTLTRLLLSSSVFVAVAVAGCDLGAPVGAELDTSPLYGAQDKPVTGVPGLGEFVPDDAPIDMTADRDTSGYE